MNEQRPVPPPPPPGSHGPGQNYGPGQGGPPQPQPGIRPPGQGPGAGYGQPHHPQGQHGPMSPPMAPPPPPPQQRMGGMGAPMAPPQPKLSPRVTDPRPMPDHDPHRDSIAIEEGDAPGSVQPSSKIKLQTLGMSSGLHKTQTEYKRKTCATGQGACRVRSFHGRLSDEGMSYMDDKINEWLDAHPDIEIKHVTTTIGLYDGKIKEQALIVNVWY